MLTEDAKRIKKKKGKIDTSEEGKGVEAIIDIKDLRFDELKALAKKRKIWERGMLKEDLVKILS